MASAFLARRVFGWSWCALSGVRSRGPALRGLASLGLASRRVASLGAVLLGAAVAGLAPTASGQTAIERANALYADIVPDRRSDLVLLPAIAAMDPVPTVAERPEEAALLFSGSEGWSAAESWATGPAQVAALEALVTVTRERDFLKGMAFGLPYGATDVPPELISARMYVELGDPPLLADARLLYLSRLTPLLSLVHVEATRRAAAGEPLEAVDILLRLAQFGRQMADRELLDEATWGYTAAIDALRRCRDVLYQDFQGRRQADPGELLEVVKTLEADKGFLAMNRLLFPRANEIAAEQLLSQVYVEKRGPDESRFVPTMTRITSGGRPLRRFAATSEWAALVGVQEDWFDAQDALKHVSDDWRKRWDLPRFDPVHALPFEAERIDREKLSAVVVGLRLKREASKDDLGSRLWGLRTLLELERAGTRVAMSVVGQYNETGIFPKVLNALRPRWVEDIEPDALNSDREFGRVPALEYFVPIRDAYVKDRRRDEPKPHEMEVFPDDGTNFVVELRDDQFVLYSVGGNRTNDFARRVSQNERAEVGDYLIWPPLLSLDREHLRQTGGLR